MRAGSRPIQAGSEEVGRAKAQQAKKEVKNKLEGKAENAKQEAKKKVEAGQEDLKKKVEAGQEDLRKKRTIWRRRWTNCRRI